MANNGSGVIPQQPVSVACPLISTPSGQGFMFGNCIGLKCSWYDTFRQQCVVISINQKLSVQALGQVVKP